MARILFTTPWLYALSGKVFRRGMPWLPRWLVYNRLNPWGKQRELPPVPRQSFREMYKSRNER